MELTRWLRNQADRVAAAVFAVGGLIAIGLGWRGVADVSLATEQIPYLASGAVLGIFLLGVSATLWLSADLHDEWRKLDDLHHSLARWETAVSRTLGPLGPRDETSAELRPDPEASRQNHTGEDYRPPVRSAAR
jgi:hypothetical protein